MSKTAWGVAAVVASVGSCCLLGGLVLAVGAASDSDVPVASAVVAAGSTGRGPRAGAPAQEDDFLFVSSEGLTSVSTARIVARGQPVPLAGLWRDDRSNFSLRLEPDSSYELQSSGGSSGGGALTVESGAWSATGTSLRLSPASVSLQTVHLPSKHQEQTARDPGGPRDYLIEGLGLEYVPYGRPGASARRVEGLSFAGAVPSWSDEPSGQWAKTLRRAPQ